MKKIISILAVLTVAMTINFAAAKPQGPKSSPSYGDDDSHKDTSSTPIGTSTGLMLTLGAVSLCYKLHDNNKKCNKD